MAEHFRTLLLIKVSGINAPFLILSEADRPRYETSSKIYSQEQCLLILDWLIETQNQIRFQNSAKIALEAILLRILRVHQRLPIEFLVRRLHELEQAVLGTPPASLKANPIAVQEIPVLPKQISETTPPPPAELKPKPLPTPAKQLVEKESHTEDPTPTPEDLGLSVKPKASEKKETAVPSPAAAPSSTAVTLTHKQHRYDTILQFAAVELEGAVRKKPINVH